MKLQGYDLTNFLFETITPGKQILPKKTISFNDELIWFTEIKTNKKGCMNLNHFTNNIIIFSR
jgi:hypothetical protein